MAGDGGQRRSRPRDGKMRNDGSHPGGRVHFICDHVEEPLISIAVLFKELLRDSLRVRDANGRYHGERTFSSPNSNSLVAASYTHIDAAGVDAEVELTAPKTGDPIKPLNARSKTCGVHNARGKAVWAEGKATTT